MQLETRQLSGLLEVSCQLSPSQCRASLTPAAGKDDGQAKSPRQQQKRKLDNQQQPQSPKQRYEPRGSGQTPSPSNGRPDRQQSDWKNGRADKLHPHEVETGKLLKEDPPRLSVVETEHTITIGRTSYQKQDLADACACAPADKCWAVAMSSKPWPLKLHTPPIV